MDTGREVEEMGAIAIPVLPIREEINLELKEDQREDNDLFLKSNSSMEDEEPEMVNHVENQHSVDESGACVRPVIALRNLNIQ